MFKVLKKLKTKNSILTFYVLYNEGVIEEADLIRMTGVDTNRMKAIASELVSQKLMSTAIDGKGRIYYLLNTKIYNTKKCTKCSRFKTKTTKVKGIELSTVTCSRKNCKHRFMLDCINKINGVKEVTTPIIVNTIKKNTNRNDVPLEEWEAKDFSKYIIKKFKNKYIGVKFPENRLMLDKSCGQILTLIMGFVNSQKAKLYCKKHIDYVFSTMTDDTKFNLRDFTNFSQINKTINISTDGRKKVAEACYCSKHDLDCTYCKDGVCTLEADGNRCTDLVIEYMKKNYK